MNSAPDNYKDDPTATYRGYRRQALYCLFRLFDDGLPENYVIHPEGDEDLEILDPSGNPIEVVQVKDYSSPLTASSLEPPFYKRIKKYCVPESKVDVKIVSFGDVGPELAKAFDNEQETPKRTLDTLTKDRNVTDSKGNKKTISGVSEEEAVSIFSHVEIVKVDEEHLKKQVLEKLKTTITCGDPAIAFDALMWWLKIASEQQQKLDRLKTVDQLNQIGRFINHRAVHEHEWNISIKPIEYSSEYSTSDQIEEGKLRSEFFQGGRVRPRHIAANLDVPRTEALQEINKLFQQENVVILRAASGQGKTTLAYRYLLEWAPDSFRYEILQAADLQHARRMAAAMKGHTEAIDVPTVVYLDVRPGDNLWVEFVRELSDVSSLRILVTIREEDWFRSRITKDQFSFSDCPIQFDEDSGRKLFHALKKSGLGETVLDFTDAWSKLGERKTLFEFVYLATQNEQLSDRIKAQISSLKDQVNKGTLREAELKLLRLVAIASAYEARLNLKELVRYVEIPEPTRTLERFGNEYLLRISNDGRYVEGFHAIRSEIIAEELSDEVLQPRGEIEAEVLPLLVEDDLESFLLYSFSKNPNSADNIARTLKNIYFQTWSGARGVFTALQWLGLKKYADANAALIDNVRAIYGSGWWITLDWDLAQVRGKSGFGFLDSLRHMSKEMEFAAVSVENIQKQQTNKDDVFDYIAKWFQEFRVPAIDPITEYQFIASAEVMFWLGHLKLKCDAIEEWFSENLITRARNVLPIHLFAAFAYACRKIKPDVYANWLDVNIDEVRLQLRENLSLIAFIEDEQCLVSHFVIDDIERKNSGIRPSDEIRSINELAVDRIEVISHCLPGYEKYGTVGYGHQKVLFGSSYDESTKHIPVENLSIPWLPEFNALAQGVVELRFRPKTWDVYFDQVQSIRKSVLIVLQDLRASVSNMKIKGAEVLKNIDLWDECLRNLNLDLFLPANSVDEWGYITETRSSNSFQKLIDIDKEDDKNFREKIKKFSALEKFGARLTLEPLNKALDEYTRTVSKFLEQSKQGLVLLPNLHAAQSPEARKKILEAAKEVGVHESSIRLSVLNGFDACTAVKKLQIEEDKLHQNTGGIDTNNMFREMELREFIESLRVWVLYCYPEQITSKSKQNNQKKIRRSPKIGLRDSLNNTENRIKDSLKRLKSEGIDARVLTDRVQWGQDTAIWISFDVQHPLGTLVALDRLWYSLVESFRPDKHKIVKIKAVEYYWKKIVLIPLVKGRSLEKQAFPNISSLAFMVDDEPEPKIWEYTPELIPSIAWEKLKLTCWDKQKEWGVFDQLNIAYSTLYYHVDHIADFSRCSVDLDEAGEKILQDYIKIEEKRLAPFLQETFDGFAVLFEMFPEINEAAMRYRPNIVDCLEILGSISEYIYPCENYEQHAKLTIDQIANWRDRLEEGFNVLAQARCLWVADSLGLGRFDYPQ